MHYNGIAHAINCGGTGEYELHLINGNIAYSDKNGFKQLTSTGHDKAPCLSSDNKLVVFLRENPNKLIESDMGGPIAQVNLWIIGIDGTGERLVLEGLFNKNPKYDLSDIEIPQFSPDGKNIYFIGSAGAVTGSVRSASITDGKMKTVTLCKAFIVIPTGEYKGDLIVLEHNYWMGGGSYDWWYLITPEGKEIGIVGPDIETVQEFLKTYTKQKT
jgi:Tol biopolymer transport system component